LQLVAPIFFRSHNGDLWEETLAEFRKRHQAGRCCHFTRKVVALAFGSGERLSIEGKRQPLW